MYDSHSRGSPDGYYIAHEFSPNHSKTNLNIYGPNMNSTTYLNGAFAVGKHFNALN
jgi:hypothetical protein